MTSNIIRVKDVNGNGYFDVDTYSHTMTMKDETGKLVTMDLGQADVHIDSALSNYAAGYKQWEGIADAVCPIVPVDKASNKFYTWDKDDVFQASEDLIVGPGGAVKEISGRVSSDSYSTVSYGIGAAVTSELAANADAALKIEMQYMRRCMNVINLGREQRVASLVMSSANWTGGTVTAIAAGAKWNGGATSDPINDLLTAVRASLTPVDAIVMSERTWHDFVTNAAVQKYLVSKIDAPALPAFGASAQGRVADGFSALLGLPPFIIGRQKKKSSASAYSYVWGDNVALIRNEPGIPSDGQTISTAKTFRWTGADAGAVDGNGQGGFLVRSYYDPRRGARGTKVMVVTHNDAEKMTSTVAGALLTGAHA